MSDEKNRLVFTDENVMGQGDHSRYPILFQYEFCSECQSGLTFAQLRRFLGLRFYRGKLDFRINESYSSEVGHCSFALWITPKLDRAIKRHRLIKQIIVVIFIICWIYWLFLGLRFILSLSL